MEKEIKRENACFPSFDMIMGFPSRYRNEITMDTGDEDEIKKNGVMKGKKSTKKKKDLREKRKKKIEGRKYKKTKKRKRNSRAKTGLTRLE